MFIVRQDKPEYVFGTTVVDTSGLQGRVYHLKAGTHALPRFEQLRPVGSIYTTSLNVWPQNFDQGFPNISDRFEWFAIEYTGRIWIENCGHYRFSLWADDGAKLYLNNQVVIDNGGAHGSYAISGSTTPTRGVHEIKVEYYQGPRFTVALVLAVSPPGEPWRIFNMNDFKPPNDTDQLQKGEISDIRSTTQCARNSRPDRAQHPASRTIPSPRITPSSLPRLSAWYRATVARPIGPVGSPEVGAEDPQVRFYSFGVEPVAQ